ncbi:MAG: phenylalanyl-tRNA synthetase beta chain, partial [Bacteroidota bacterium]|nr:phenylalanyl-tRNA synthetase beta chain [Bacteroidota bacterium]
MLASYKWLKELSGCDYSPEETEKILTMLGIEVESIIDYRKKYEQFIVAEVFKAEKHPGADKLTICEVGDGSDTRTVICGAPNVAAGQKVLLGLPGAVVPQAGFMIERRTIRKVESEGMICSQFELELGDDKSGIWVLPEDAPTGKPLAEYLHLDDI